MAFKVERKFSKNKTYLGWFYLGGNLVFSKYLTFFIYCIYVYNTVFKLIPDGNFVPSFILSLKFLCV